MKFFFPALWLLFLWACAPAPTPPVLSPPEPRGVETREYRDLRSAYDELLAFRDDAVFIREGFSANSLHADWLAKVRDMPVVHGYSEEGSKLLAALAVSYRRNGPGSELARAHTSRFEEYLQSIRFERPSATPLPTQLAAVLPTAPLFIVYTGDTQGVVQAQPGTSEPVGGIARRLAVITALRATHPDLVLLDAGDAFSPVPQAASGNSALLVAMNQAGYDAMGIGPQDLAMGEDALRSLATQARFPLLCSNLLFSSQPEWIKPYVVLNRGGCRVAVLSILPPPEGALPRGATLLSPEETLLRYMPELSSKAQRVVILTQYVNSGVEGMLNERVDVIIRDSRGKMMLEPTPIVSTVPKGMGLGVIGLGDGWGTARVFHRSILLTKDAIRSTSDIPR